MIEENDTYMVREVSEDELRDLMEIGCGIDQGVPINYAVVNKDTKRTECYSGNLPNAIHIANVFSAGVKKETNQPDMSNVTPLNSH